MQKTNASITAALEAQRPHIAADYVAYVQRLHSRLVEKYGASFRGIYNTTDAKPFKELVNPCRVNDATTGYYVPGVLNTAKLEAMAATYAEAVTAAWEMKITAKLGMVQDVTATDMSARSFTIRGTLAGQPVMMQQQTIINVSSAGRLFHQFPSHLYLAGKFMSEAAFKKAAAALA